MTVMEGSRNVSLRTPVMAIRRPAYRPRPRMKSRIAIAYIWSHQCNMQVSGADIHLLRVFDSVVRNNGFSAAQAELGISQPTISNHITALEERLGVKLCQRGRRGFRLTEKGETVHRLAQDLLGTLEDMSGRLSALKGSLTGEVRIAIVDCIATDPQFKMPQAIGDLARMAPTAKFNILIEQPQNILRGLADGSFHIGIGAFDNRLTGLSYKALYQETNSLYCGEGHPLFSRLETEIDQPMLDRYPWVHRGYWNRRRKKTQKLNDTDQVVGEIEAQLLLVLSGSYLGLLPDHAARSYLEAGRLRRFGNCEDNFTCSMELVTRSDPQPHLVKTLCDALLDQSRGGSVAAT
ncbi:DNA-binding transcriptional LysR family regulator [Limimaricola variabilis]|uniref:DNA-binding transcriptional LysR family regulator n=1 Tax=Limimaricola variabilis TaxID=1492771 RepID=A0ABR6HMM4_9RHOB|nr:DNA-binding transcriptional LysR family regulator [Limimaricola variabilis]